MFTFFAASSAFYEGLLAEGLLAEGLFPEGSCFYNCYSDVDYYFGFSVSGCESLICYVLFSPSTFCGFSLF